MTGGEDRLSALGDDILQRILYFTPAKETTSTSVLSRRWGNLWKTSGAVNLTVRALNYYRLQGPQGQGSTWADEAFSSHRDAFINVTSAALAASDDYISRLTLHVEADFPEILERFFNRHWNRQDLDLVDYLVLHPAACRLEELRIAG